MYVVKLTQKPEADSRTRFTRTGYLTERTFIGTKYWDLGTKNEAATFTSKRNAQTAARDWRALMPTRLYEIIPN